jgi:hypothetical protein
MIIVTHIPKTGGSSFLQYLRQVYGWRLHLDYRHRRPDRLPWLARLLGLCLGRRGGVPAGTACVIGHFRADKYDPFFPKARHAIWLRDPIERVVSNYYYFLRHPDPNHRLSKAVNRDRVSLEEYASQRAVCQRQVYQLAGKPLSAFAFVGITEHYAASVQLFSRIFGCPEPAAVPQFNQNPEKQGGRYALPPALRERLHALTERDDQLYRAGLQRFAELCRACGVRLEERGESRRLAS